MKRRWIPRRAAWLFAMLVFGQAPLFAKAPAPPTELTAQDSLNDNGTRIELTWKLSPDDVAPAEGGVRGVIRYKIFRKANAETEFRKIGDTSFATGAFRDNGCRPDGKYLYQVIAVAPDASKSAPVATTEPITPTLQWYDHSKTWYGIMLLFVAGAIVFYIQVANSGRDLKIRKIAGLEAVDEAVGRATEMGRTCLFIPGILDINDIQTIAGLTVLSRVAQTAAEYGAHIEVPTTRSLVMAAARETVEAACLTAGRPDAYNEDDIYYLTDEQFGYVAGVTGTMVRDKPAACFYMGAFYAESLILAETGHSVGAIQVAGTAMPSQLPFFVAACDYTLIGEEFFAASAYLSGEPAQLGSLKGQDVGKLLAASLLVVGCGLATWNSLATSPAISGALSFITDNILGDKGLLP